jgi:protein-disulfide isomerase
MKEIVLELQYFDDCPNVPIMYQNATDAMDSLDFDIELKNIIVADNAKAERIGFRGSPTLLINGQDLLDMPKPENPSLSCRNYPNGIPTAEDIMDKILEIATE